MRDVEANAYGWVRFRQDSLVCEHCDTSRYIPDAMTKADFQRELYDFLLRHKHCRPPERPQ